MARTHGSARKSVRPRFGLRRLPAEAPALVPPVIPGGLEGESSLRGQAMASKNQPSCSRKRPRQEFKQGSSEVEGEEPRQKSSEEEPRYAFCDDSEEDDIQQARRLAEEDEPEEEEPEEEFYEEPVEDDAVPVEPPQAREEPVIITDSSDDSVLVYVKEPEVVELISSSDDDAMPAGNQHPAHVGGDGDSVDGRGGPGGHGHGFMFVGWGSCGVIRWSASWSGSSGSDTD